MELGTITGILSIIISTITIFKVVISSNTTMVQLKCSIDNLTSTIEKNARKTDEQDKEIELIKIELAEIKAILKK